MREEGTRAFLGTLMGMGLPLAREGFGEDEEGGW